MDNLRGIALMVLAMAGFTLTDMFIKRAAADLPVGQIMAMLGGGGGALFALLTLARGHAVLARDFFAAPVMLRNGCEMVGAVAMLTALSLVDLTTVSAILQATPLAVTIGAVLFLGERVGWRRWIATLVGFLGVLIIMRPGLAGFTPDTLWALGAMVVLGMRDLVTRVVPHTIPTLRVSTYGLAMLLPAGLILMALGDGVRPMSAANWGQMGGAVVISVLGYYAITAAMRIGEISVISPFRYSRIVFALVVGAVVFGERPDFWTLAGAALTIAAGLYIFLRERHAALPLRTATR